MKTFLVTFSDDRMGRKGGVYKQTQTFLHQYIKDIVSTPIDHRPYDYGMFAQSDFYQKNFALCRHIDAAKNGRVFKPWAICEILREAAADDFVIYSDCSPEMWDVEKVNFYYHEHNNRTNLPNLDVLLNLCSSNNGILSPFIKWDTVPLRAGDLGIHTHRHFTTDRCMQVMGMVRYENSFMPASGMMVFRKNKLSMDFINRWLTWNKIDQCSALGWANRDNDYSFWDGEDEKKMGHRHDQSVAGLLINDMNPNCVDHYQRDWPGHNFLNYCYTGQTYNMIDTNTIVKESASRIFKGDHVINEQGIKLKVFEIRSINNVEWILVGLHRESLYMTTADKLKKV
jgi:hypothetical protein